MNITIIIVILSLVSYNVPYSDLAIEPYEPIEPHKPIVPYDPYNTVLEDIIINDVLCTFTSPGSNHSPINITNNHHAIDVSYDEVIKFIKNDKTDERMYINNNFMCGEFATMVHDHAEVQGIKAHVVAITYNDNLSAHMINGFNTTDKGMIFIDCTGTTLGNTHMDKEIVLIKNEDVIEKSIYRETTWVSRPVKNFYIV